MSSPVIEAVPLVTDTEARLHLRIDGAPESPAGPVDQLLTTKILQASDIVADYIKSLDHGWDEDTAPPSIKAAVLLVLNALYDRPDQDPLTAGVKSILHRYRDPALA
jgi:hypothetical protein